jgi:hypothetical protein
MATNETKWTPGPWRVDYQTANDPGCERLAVFSAAYIDEEPGVCAGSTAWPLTREDANLIAAAPDLYAALARLASEVETIPAAMARIAPGVEIGTSNPALDAARAALARAEGR